LTQLITLSKAEACRLLTRYHFRSADAEQVFKRLGSIQFDPLKPVGCNHDLVLQARVPGYRVDHWQTLAYGQTRLLYDAWDKQACLVRLADWPQRRIYHRWHAAYWQQRVLEPFPEAVAAVLAELRARGPLRSAAFDFQVHQPQWQGSWHGAKLTKNVLRALWHTGQVVTYTRLAGQHVYALTEQVIPAELRHAEIPDETDNLAWLIKARHQAVGLLRPNASSEVWSLALTSPRRKALIAQLVQAGELCAVEIEGVRYHALPTFFEAAETPLPDTDRETMHFLAPLDPLLWDRQALAQLFGFDYVWEVYKPQAQRKWGYYVLPVLYQGRFVGRFDSRCKAGCWDLLAWHWEPGVQVDAPLLRALNEAVKCFKAYLQADQIKLPAALDRRTREAWLA